jgi:putative ABC transport system permease protein
VKALDRKLIRDLLRLWSQALTIALVVASGIGGFLTCLSAVDSLALARDRFYTQARFADLFASVKRAPNALAEVLGELPGVAFVQTTIEHVVRVQIEGVTDPIVGQLIGMDPRGETRLNRVTVASGQSLLEAGAMRDGALAVLVNQGFATTRGLRPGARLSALINGKQRPLVVVGTALSPEYIFAGLAGMPDLRGFGVFWLDREALAAAYDMRGAFNRVAIRIAPAAHERAVIDAVSQRLAPYGGREANGRDDQPSHRMLDNEIKEQQVMGTVLPAIFLGVAAFLLNVVVSRLVATQREQIAALKALGYRNATIVAHYLQLVLAIVAIGVVIGVAVGDWMGGHLTALYAGFFFFPSFEHRIAPDYLLISVGITAATAVIGTLNAILATARLAPAEAMRPPAPGRYRPTLVERMGLSRLSPGLRMILRNMERRPLRTGVSITGVAAAIAIVVMGNFFSDAIDHIMNTVFQRAMRGDVTLFMNEASNDDVRHAIARLPGVTAVEPGRDLRVRFVHGHRRERGSIQGLASAPELRRIIDIDGRPWAPTGDGLLLTDRLAGKLGAVIGDTIEVEALEGEQRRLLLRVDALVPEMMGLNAYMTRDALNHALGDGELATQFAVGVERGREHDLLEASKGLPQVAATFSKATLVRNMQDVSARNIRMMSTILTTLATIIAIGVVYNNARIALAERTWELASLRVLGFTRAEVSTLLLGEMALSIAIALPIGIAAGYGLVHGIVYLLRSDQFSFPVVILPRTYALACLAVLASALASAFVVRRNIDRLDLVAALKTRE